MSIRSLVIGCLVVFKRSPEPRADVYRHSFGQVVCQRTRTSGSQLYSQYLKERELGSTLQVEHHDWQELHIEQRRNDPCNW